MIHHWNTAFIVLTTKISFKESILRVFLLIIWVQSTLNQFIKPLLSNIPTFRTWWAFKYIYFIEISIYIQHRPLAIATKRLKFFLFLNHLYNKTRHSFIYMLHIAGQTAGLIGLVDIFCGHPWVAGGCYGLQNFKKKFKFFQISFFHGQRRALQLVISGVILKGGGLNLWCKKVSL